MESSILTLPGHLSHVPEMFETSAVAPEATCSAAVDENSEVEEEGQQVGEVDVAGAETGAEEQVIGEDDVDEEEECALMSRQTPSQPFNTPSSVDNLIGDDPAYWPEKLSDTDRCLIVRKGPVQVQGDFPQNQQGRQFTTTYYYLNMKNGEKIRRSWLVYSKTKDSAVCFCCRLFGECNKQRFCSDGTSDWKNVAALLKEHEKSADHLAIMTAWRTLHQRLTTDSLSSLLTQSPGTIEVAVGDTVTFTCNHNQVLTYCHAISWIKIEPTTGQLNTRTHVNTISNEQGDICTATLTDVTREDAGMYYCLAVHSSVCYFGNGSKVIVTGSVTASPMVRILLPAQSDSADHDSGVPLICVVTGVDQLRVQVQWTVSGQIRDGETESFWVAQGGSATELTENRIVISAAEWEGGVQCTCVVEYAGKTIYKTVRRDVVFMTTLVLSPSSVQVRSGDSLTLSCRFWDFKAFCYTVTWFRVHPRTQEIDTSTRIVAHPDDSYTDEYTKATRPVVQVLSPLMSDNQDSFIPLLCWVTEVVPSQVRIRWMVDGQEADVGMTGPTWTPDGKWAAEHTQGWLVVPVELWERGAECVCVVEYAGQTITRPMQHMAHRDKDMRILALLRIKMMASHLLLYLSLAQVDSFIVTQSPDLEVMSGSTASLQCDIGELYSSCSRVVWLKLDPRKPMTLHVTDRVKEVDPNDFTDTSWVSVCRATIPHTTVNDAGMYYSVLSQGRFAHVGNGTRLTVTEPESSLLPPSIEVVPPVAYTSMVPLLCVVAGVSPSQVHVFWLIEGTVEGGWTDSALEDDGDPQRRLTQNQILLPAEMWERGLSCSCVVEVGSQSFSKTLQHSRTPDHCFAVFCTYIVAGITSSFFLLLLVGITSVCLCRLEV
ncbi:hypothetical protein ACEWY4_024454 [Coilia grayii]|uniref:Ig-like domain-containing protein n=1 Tax=Coilia grayii TaxID=363190 RepID=A0ABD1J3H9_9TELE